MKGGKDFEEFCKIAKENADNLFSYTYKFRIKLLPTNPGLQEEVEQAESTTTSDEESGLMENNNDQTETYEQIIYLKLLHLIILLRRKNFLRFILSEVDAKFPFTEKISIYPTKFVSCGKDSWIFGANFIHFAARFDPEGLHLILSQVDGKIDLINTSLTERKWSPLHVAVLGDDSTSTRFVSIVRPTFSASLAYALSRWRYAFGIKWAL